jgi:hypothetical protein
MTEPDTQREKALRERLGLRTPPEWEPRVQELDSSLVGGHQLHLTAAEYDVLLAPIIRLRLRRALMHALDDGVIGTSAQAQILGYLSHGRMGTQLEDLLDGGRFPNLASPDFGFLRTVKERLRQDVRLLRSAVHHDP